MGGKQIDTAAVVDAGTRLLTSENIVISTLAIMLVFALIGNVVQYRDYRRDRQKPWQYVHELTGTMKQMELLVARLMERIN